jgi:hypothetical protein
MELLMSYLIASEIGIALYIRRVSLVGLFG